MENKIKKLIGSILGINESSLTDTYVFKDSPRWDSMKFVELILAIEEEFKLRLSSDEIISMTSYGQIKSILAKKGIQAT